MNWLYSAAGGLSVFVIFLLFHIIDVDRIEDDYKNQLKQQKTQLEKTCADDKATTERGQHELQTRYDDITGKLAAAKRMQPSRCVVPTITGTAHAPAVGPEHAGQNGISSDWLRDYAAECESYRSDRIALEKFIDDTWKARGQ